MGSKGKVTQLADNREVVERLGGLLGEELSDGLSAWKRGVRRPGWERLLERVQAGESDGIVVWHTDRLFRQPRDLEKLIELADKGFRVTSAHGSRDLSDPDDRFILRIEVAQSAKESDDKSRRVRRRFQAKREQGVAHPGGPRRFGWPGRDLAWTPGPGEEESDRPMVSASLVERERAALRDGTDAQLTGVGQGTIADEWNAAGLRTAAGLEWVANTVKGVLLRPTNAGLIEYEGKLVGRTDEDPIVDPEKFERLRSIYAARRRGRAPGKRHIGSGILRCGVKGCGNKLSVRISKEYYRGTDTLRGSYYCNRQRRGCGRVYADMRSVNKELRLITIARLSDERYAEAITAARARVAERLAVVQEEIATCEQIQRALSERLGRREISLDAFDEANAPLVKDLAKFRAELEKLLGGGSPEGPTRAQRPEDVAEQWDDGDNAARRALLTQAAGRRWVVVYPTPQSGKRVFDPDRVKLVDPPQRAADRPTRRQADTQPA